MNMLLSDIQLVLFSSIFSIPDKLKVSYAFQSILINLFESQPVILPIPEDAPLDIPRIQLASTDKRGLLAAARNRIDLKLIYREEDKVISLPISNVFQKFLDIFNYLVNTIQAQVIRCAIVTNWIADRGGNSCVKFLFSKYIRNDIPISESNALEVHYLTKETIAEFNANKWTRIKSVRKRTDPTQEGIILHIDINTIPEENYQFTQNSLQLFLEQSSLIINETIEEHLRIWENKK